ncbi:MULTISPECIES: glycerol dehydrogenase [Halomonas]|uniref:Glycerol dehydrogenase n=1 Tax=Halomonas citrativorans TaxID=2742612 RepID=A0A1R4I348_9GAMM|nr:MULTISPECIES: glycerol dehydrogenase [Halomonas]MBE0402345.1 glycerol dehydrogenase [Halomonas citrativorans]SJN14240.1 Glycerol dehydrogenase [Halomonas citrativorans]HCR98872.1 glycerol dehydrogenase [Halomonas sp.]
MTAINEKVFISPGRYVQGEGVTARAGHYVSALGKTALLIADDVVWDIAGKELSASLEGEGVSFERAVFEGEASTREIDRLVELGRKQQADVVIGFGGGKAIDTAKGVAEKLEAACAILPTTASTDAPTSALSVIYSDDGEFESYRFYSKNPDLVLVDTGIICKAPPRFLASGIADALATWVEARAAIRANANNMAGGKATLLGATIGEKCEDILFEHAMLAYQANEAQIVTPSFEAVVEANTLLSGLGFESGGLAAAHAIHNGFTALHGEIHNLTHGEKVAYGTVAQLILDQAPQAELEEYLDLYLALGLPVTLKALKLDQASEEDLYRVAEAALKEGESSHNLAYELTPKQIVHAIKAVDVHARAFMEKVGLSE